jgi:hypothetical protein
MDHAGLYLWLWILIGNAIAIIGLSSIGGTTSAMGSGLGTGMGDRDVRMRDPNYRDPGNPNYREPGTKQ